MKNIHYADCASCGKTIAEYEACSCIIIGERKKRKEETPYTIGNYCTEETNPSSYTTYHCGKCHRELKGPLYQCLCTPVIRN